MNDSSYKEIITLAIRNETEAYDFYQGVANISQNKAIKSIFQEMAEQELEHRDFLQSCLDGSVKTINFKTPPDYNVSEKVEKPKLSVNMKPVDAIALAMKNEEEAVDMYQTFADISNDEEQKKLFLELVKMETSHKANLENLYTNMAFPEKW